ncbi:MAG: hypothetical protein AB1631_02655 [Acidobacteriota bacterium]
MKAKHHFFSSLAAGGALYFFTGHLLSLAGAMIGGFLIDADHVIDQLWAIARRAPLMKKIRESEERGLRAWWTRYVRRRKLVRLPLVFHSYEILAALVVTAFMIRSPFLTGLAAGYALHLALDIIRHHHEFRSPLFYLLLYRLAHGFRRERLIKPEYL